MQIKFKYGGMKMKGTDSNETFEKEVKYMKEMKKKKKKGFTLIELIVVVAILGILAAIAIPKFSGFKETANEGAVKATLKNIDTAIQGVATENNIDPTDVTKAQVTAMLGSWPDGSPTGAVYDIDSDTGKGELTTKPSPYPTAGITELP
jgi:type IV pilus assembly protein PilA